MEKNAEKIWTNCLKIIKDIVEWQHFKTWFEPIKPVSLKNNVLVIQVPSQFFFEYLEEHYVNLLAKTLKRELGKDARLEYHNHADGGAVFQVAETFNFFCRFQRTQRPLGKM